MMPASPRPLRASGQAARPELDGRARPAHRVAVRAIHGSRETDTIARGERDGRPAAGQGRAAQAVPDRQRGRPALHGHAGARPWVAEAPPTDQRRVAATEEPLVVTLVDRAVATQDRAAFGRLFDRFGGQIHAYLAICCGQPAAAEELTEQVFLAAWRAIGRYRWQGRPFVTWLYRLAHDAHLDWPRRGDPVATLADAAEVLPRPNPSDDSVLGAPVDAETLARAVRQLSREQQQVLYLRFTADLDTGAIAEIMGEPERAIRTLQLHAVQHLSRLLTSGAS